MPILIISIFFIKDDIMVSPTTKWQMCIRLHAISTSISVFLASFGNFNYF